MASMKISSRTVAASRPATSRRAVVVAASADRRAVLTGFIAGAAALTVGKAEAANPIDLFDDRAKKAQIADIYEARDDTISFKVRDGLDQARGDLKAVQERVSAAEDRIDKEIEPLIQKQYWTDARNRLRLDVGTLRFDLNTLAESKPKEAKKKALELRKDFIAKFEALDDALRTKDQASALKSLQATKGALDVVIASVQ